MMTGRVLVVDDERNITFVIQAMLEKAGFEVIALNASQDARDVIATEDFDVVITDLYMPGISGMEILDFCIKTHPDLPVVMITAYGTIESAVGALKQGAFDFVTKPFEQSELLHVIEKAVATHRQRQKEPIIFFPHLALHAEVVPALGLVEGASQQNFQVPISSMVGSSHQIQEIFRVITKIAHSPSTVLICGESGTGKELVAYEIHRQSERAEKSFVKINCAAIPATLIESELFGYEKGAFTGAVASKPGRFELAHEGTLFLDEVADMPSEMQVKLLRLLQEQEFERVGGIHTIQVDVRIIAATNKDLESEVKQGRFREDLFYRLNVIPIHLPALRERKDDIEPLVRYFLSQFNEKLKKQISGLTPETLMAFKTYQWPGNIRQLENLLERMMLMCEGGVLTIDDLPEELFPHSKCEGLETSLNLKQIIRRQTQSLERVLIEKALEEMSGNVTQTAEKLGLSRKGLQLKIKELGIKRG